MTFSEFDLQRSRDALLTLARAFDVAWDPFLAEEGDRADIGYFRRRLAARIVALARSGQTDEAELGAAGLAYLQVLKEASQLSDRIRSIPVTEIPVTASTPQPDPQSDEMVVPASSAGHDAVEAMSTALDRCLDELPLQIPPNTVHVLSRSIVGEAARGERNPERLHLHAMARLMSHPSLVSHAAPAPYRDVAASR